MVEARDNEKAQREKEEQERREWMHININTDPPHPTSVGEDQDMYRTVSTPLHSSLDPPDVTTDSPSVIEIEIRHDSQGQPDDHLPRPTEAVVGNKDEPEHTSRDASSRLDPPGEEERLRSHTETDEAPSALEDCNERSQHEDSGV